eukprot:g5821.t1
MSPWQPPVLPVEVFRDVPPEECLQSPLTEKRVDASSYEFGCEEIYTMLMGKKKLIGRGYIRDVYLVEWEGRKLVVKFLREDYEAKASEARVEKIHRMEAAALDAVRGHPNIVDLLGICGASSVSEYYDVHLDDIILTKGAKPLPITKVVSMALDLARGLQALHEAPGGPIVHFDIKPQQMMMDAEEKLRINDLNLVRFPDADKDGNSCPFKSGASGVDSWRAPENIAGEYLTEKVDVYGMAMVFYSMLALFPPYTDVPDGTGNIKKGMPPTTDPSWHPGFLGIVQDMWNPNPKARPSARRVVQRLEILQQHLAMQTFNALAAINRGDGRFHARCLLQWLARPGTFVFMAVCLLLAPSLWFASQAREKAPVFRTELEREKGRPTLLRVPPKKEVGISVVQEIVPRPAAGAERVKEATAARATAARTTAVPVPPAQPSGREDSKGHRGHRGLKEYVKPSWQPPVLPMEVFRDVPPDECLRSPLWEKKVDPSEYEFGCDEINALLAGEKELIGNGNIRDVYLVDHGGRKLVIKALREDYGLRAGKSRVDKIHRWEAAALDAIKGHPNMVGMLGTCGASSVSEYYPTHLDDLVLAPGAKPLPISMVVSMALDAARGLQALHEAPGGAIVHFDIKPQQLMLDSKGRVKINDLNMCRFVDADADGNTCAFESKASRVGPFRSPENIAGENLTEKVDIYGMAMVYYCMLALHPPYKGVKDAKTMISNGLPPPVEPSWHPGFLEIVQDMWQRDPKARPSARRVVQRLEILQKRLALGNA